MTSLINAIRTKDTHTENGMAAHSTTLNNCVDLFASIGAMRGQDKTKIINLFTKAYGDDPLTATKLLFWTRDIRGGAGERAAFQHIITHMAKSNKKEVLRKNLALIPEYGYYKDLLVLIGTDLEGDALELIATALKGGNQLCAKWMPRGNGKNRDNKRYANAIRKFLGLDPKSYRKLLAENTDVVETKMCAKDFTSINYSHVPSKAMSGYMRAFGKHDHDGFTKYLDALQKGDGSVKINTGAIYPYDVIKSLRSGNSKGASLQWDSLPDFLEGSKERVLPVVDTSGSMFWPEAKISGDLYAGHVAQSLGLYVSERNTGPFKDAIVDFSSRPRLNVYSGDLADRYRQLEGMNVGGSTNIKGVFEMMLQAAKTHKLPSDEMPTMILIFSDMQFDEASGRDGGHWGRQHEQWNPTAQEMIEEMYEEAGYATPKVVYWQTNARNTNKPVQFDKQGTALVSGFSPAILSNLLGGKDMSPLAIMNDVVNSERYAPVTI